jgi:DNA-binding NtrC family response regulator
MTDLAPQFSGPVNRVAGVRALVVDDEALIRWSVAETLAMLDIEVAQAGDAATALDALSRAAHPFDIVVLDLRLPDMNDLTLLRQVRQLMPRAFVVLMTAFGTPEIVAEAEALGTHAVLNKPFALEELSRLLSQRAGPTTP